MRKQKESEGPPVEECTLFLFFLMYPFYFPRSFPPTLTSTFTGGRRSSDSPFDSPMIDEEASSGGGRMVSNCSPMVFGVVMDEYLWMTFPSGPTRNFSKFHLTILIPRRPGFLDLRNVYSGCSSDPFTFSFCRIGKVTPYWLVQKSDSS